MSAMSKVEAKFCRSAPWRGFARRVVLPWATRGAVIGLHVLEIGGGSGAMALELLRRNEGLHLTMTDVDPAMVAAAKTRLAPFADRANAVQGDATSLDLPDNSFDTVCTWLMLHHTIEWPSVLAEAGRVVRPGGTIVGYDLTESGVSRLIHRVDRSEHQLIRPADLQAQFVRQGFEASRVDPALGGLVMRFQASVPPD